MPSSYTIGKHFEDFVRTQVESGRYASASEVIRDALRLLEDREAARAAIDKGIEEGIADADAGRVFDAEEVFDELEAKYRAMADARGRR